MASGVLKRGNPAPPSRPTKIIDGGKQSPAGVSKANVNPSRRSDPAKRNGRIG
jgi:hypothetical protein